MAGAAAWPPSPPETPPPGAAHAARWRSWRTWLWGVPALLLAAFALGESAGWPFLRAPLERTLASRLERRVALAPDGGHFSLRLLGSVRVQASQLLIGAPAWSKTPHLLDGQDVALELGWPELWRAWREPGVEPLHVRRLDAARVDAHAERGAEGRASWLLGPAVAASAPAALPRFGRLGVAAGKLHYTDAAQGTAVEAQVSLAEGSAPGAPAASFTLSASGRYQRLPLKLTLKSGGLLPWTGDAHDAPEPVALQVQATLGRATLAFEGSTTGLLEGGGLNGHFRLQGPSLAAVGDPLRVTLPTTAPFTAEGELQRRGATWLAQVAKATIGRSRVRGTFAYQQAGAGRPRLSGQLSGPRLLLADLGPAVGTPVEGGSGRSGGKVLPTRPFDLAALRVMDADVRIAIDEVNLNTPLLEPLQPLRAHLLLADGLLSLNELDARTAHGSLTGRLQLDGRGDTALWTSEVRWAGVQLQRWLRLARKEGEPPWVTGKLNGNASLQGRGRSTAEILASLQGSLRTSLGGGTLSHLAVEAAGLDLAQALGVLLQGDDALPVNCAVADVMVKDGVLRPRTLVIDTTDSVLWMDGTLSLATEALDLRVVVAPRDFSPLALRTPLRVRGPFSAPRVTLDRNPLTGKLGASLLLSLLNPLAALLPLLDPGNTEGAELRAAGCGALAQRITARR